MQEICLYFYDTKLYITVGSPNDQHNLKMKPFSASVLLKFVPFRSVIDEMKLRSKLLTHQITV